MGRDGGDGEGAPLCPRSPALRGEAGVLLLPCLAPGSGWCVPLTGRCSAPGPAQGGNFASLISWAQKFSGAAYWAGIPQAATRGSCLGVDIHPFDGKAGLGGPGGAFLLGEVAHEVHMGHVSPENCPGVVEAQQSRFEKSLREDN